MRVSSLAQGMLSGTSVDGRAERNQERERMKPERNRSCGSSIAAGERSTLSLNRDDGSGQPSAVSHQPNDA